MQTNHMNELFRMLGMDNDLVHENGLSGTLPIIEPVRERGILKIKASDKAT